MKLTSGARLGPYEIVAPIGAGGMGEVYRARDTRLDRTVAIKVLPAEFAEDAKFRIRFEREAKTISALNHPHICALYDVGPDYLVMEHCEGETLAARISAGALPLERILQYGMEMADALEKAHRQGIIHRDLKPSNVMLTKSGVKLLDFGLAKQHMESSPAEATVQRLTEEGKILGTIQYMAPELLHGKEADARSDIFALGLVLYEMTTGKPAFSGTSKASLMAAILEHEPAPLKPTSPPALDRLIRACLAKDPDERMQSAHDVKLEIRSVSAETPVATASRRRERVLAGIAAIALAFAIVAGFGVWRARTRFTPAPVRRFEITVPPEAPIDYGGGRFSVSPDGKRLAYIAQQNGTGSVWLRAMDTGETRKLAGTEGAQFAFFSPDGEWVGFCTFDEIKKISVAGSTPIAICRIQEARGVTWAADDTIIFASPFAPLFRVSAAGGAPQPLTPNDPKVNVRWPSILPDGEHVLYTLSDMSGSYEHAKTMVLSFKTRKSTLVVEGGICARYAKGHLLFYRLGTLFAAPFNVESLELTGSPTMIADDVSGYRLWGVADYAVTADGMLLYVPRNPADSQGELLWVDRKGSVTPISSERREYSNPALSPDGKELVVDVESQGRSDLWKYEIARDVWTRLTSQSDAWGAVWSPDGKRIVFSCGREGAMNLCVMPSDGSQPPQPLTHQSEAWLNAGSWSADGRQILVAEQNQRQLDIGVLDLAGENRYGRIIATPFREFAPVLSADGRWLAFGSNETSRNEVYIAAYPDVQHKFLVSKGGGESPLWRRDGRELFYTNEKKVMAADIAPGPQIAIGRPRQLFSADYATADVAVTPDGQRFIMIRKPTTPAPTRFAVITGALGSR